MTTNGLGPGSKPFFNRQPDRLLRKRLNTLRRRLRITHTELVELIGCDKSLYYKWQRGEIAPSLKSCHRIQEIETNAGIGMFTNREHIRNRRSRNLSQEWFTCGAVTTGNAHSGPSRDHPCLTRVKSEGDRCKYHSEGGVEVVNRIQATRASSKEAIAAKRARTKAEVDALLAERDRRNLDRHLKRQATIASRRMNSAEITITQQN